MTPVRRLDTRAPDFDAALALLLRFDTDDDSAVDRAAAAILADVRQRGDAALVECTERFDRWTVAAVRDLEIGGDMLEAARDRRERHSVRGGISYDGFRQLMEGEGGFVYAGWCGDAKCEAEVKEETKATIRVLPDEEFRSAEAPTSCLKCNGTATEEALWARAY